MPVPHVKPGQPWKPWKANEHNLVVDAANAHAADQAGNTFDRGRRQRDYSLLFLRNDSSTDLTRGQVLAIAGPVITNEPTLTPDQYAGRPVHSGVIPSAPSRFSVAIADEEVAKTVVGRFVASGLVAVLVDVQKTWHRRAYPVRNQHTLRSGLFGPAEILSPITATGTQLVLCSVGHSDNRLMFAEVQAGGISAASYSFGVLTLGSGTVRIIDPTSTVAQYREQAKTATVYNAECEAFAEGEIVDLNPADDWLPIARLLCTPGSESLPSESPSDSSESSGSSDSDSLQSPDSSDSDSLQSPDSSDLDSSDSEDSALNSFDSGSADSSDSEEVIDPDCYCRWLCVTGDSGFWWDYGGGTCYETCDGQPTETCGSSRYPIWHTPCPFWGAITFTNCQPPP